MDYKEKMKTCGGQSTHDVSASDNKLTAVNKNKNQFSSIGGIVPGN